MTDFFLSDLLISLTSGWSGFGFFISLFLMVVVFEFVIPSKRISNASDKRIEVNFALGTSVLAIQILPLLSSYGAALLAKSHNIGLLNWLDLPFWLSVAISFILFDLWSYWLHRASHKIPMLWRLHQVHHTDQSIDASTTFRTHPLTIVVYGCGNFIIGLLLGIEPVGVLLFDVCKLSNAWIVHADIAPFPKISAFFDKLIVTPAVHHRHHSAKQIETDSNYGELLSIWDRLFGSFTVPVGEVERYGLGDSYDIEAYSLASQLKLPFKSFKHSSDEADGAVI